MEKNKQKQTQLFWLLMVFLVPMLISSGLYYFRAVVPFHTTNHGTLVTPAFDVGYLYSATQDGDKPLWRMLYVDNGVCDANCETITYQLNQIKKALGKASDRVAVMKLGANDPVLRPMQNAFDHVNSQRIAINHKIYLIDPNGNLFMVYAGDVNPMDILKDMKKVLEVSQIG